MSAHSCQELGRQIHRYGGRPVGAFYPDPTGHQLLPSLPHALFMDYTHDNQPAAVQVLHVDYKPIFSRCITFSEKADYCSDFSFFS